LTPRPKAALEADALAVGMTHKSFARGFDQAVVIGKLFPVA
jgi:hypothetical protein